MSDAFGMWRVGDIFFLEISYIFMKNIYILVVAVHGLSLSCCMTTQAAKKTPRRHIPNAPDIRTILKF